MRFREIKELRQSGRLEEALTMALSEYEANPQGEWERKSLSWVYYDYCKRAADNADWAAFQENVSKLIEPEFVQADQFLSNSLVWCFLKISRGCLRDYSNPKDINIFLDQLFEYVQPLNLQIPGKEHSLVLDIFYRFRDQWHGFATFMEWWGWDNFEEEDYQLITLKNGKTMPISKVEGCYIAVSKHLLNEGDADTIKGFIPKIEKVADEHPEMTYPGYFEGKLRLKTGEHAEETLRAIIPFVKKKSTEFWAWQLMAEAVQDDEEKAFACLLRAANSRTKPGFLVNVFYMLARYLVAKRDFVGARKYLEKYMRVKQNSENKYVPRDVYMWTHQNWYSNATGHSIVDDIDYMKITNEILLGDLPEHIVLVTYVNIDKNIANFTYAKGKEGFFWFGRDLRPRIGSVLSLRWEEMDDNGRVKALSASEVKEIPETSFCKVVKGTIVSNARGTVHFLKVGRETYFVEPSILPRQGIDDGAEISALIAYSFNKKKNEWGWKCIRRI